MLTQFTRESIVVHNHSLQCDHAMFIVEYLLKYNLEAAQGRLDAFLPLSFRINAWEVPPTATTCEMQSDNTPNIPHDEPLTLMHTA